MLSRGRLSDRRYSHARRVNPLSVEDQNVMCQLMSPRYRSPGDRLVIGADCNKAGAAVGPRLGGSNCFDCLRAELSPHAASEQFEQHDDAILIAKLDQPTYHVLEGACGHPHKLTEPQRVLRIAPVETSSLLPLPNRIHDFGGHR